MLISSYHPSPRNVNTKLISLRMMTNLFNQSKKIIYNLILSQKVRFKIIEILFVAL